MSPTVFRATLPAFLATAMLAGGCPSETHLEPAMMMMQSDDEDRSSPRYSDSGHDLTPPSAEKKAELVEKLTPEQKRITQKAGTEPAYCGTLLDNKKDGFYACVVCGLPLFKSDDKFTSGTGWPSFTYPYDREHVVGRKDNTLGMARTEILCARCEAHLGHVFEDGPAPTGLRFCLNSEALRFHGEDEEIPEESRVAESDVAYFAGGCFWGVEYAFSELPGVYSATSGYQNGETKNPEYRQVCEGDTGHAEAVRVRFDPSKIDYETLVRFFFKIHDPTTLNRQGPDVGTQYRSGIYTTSADQRQIVDSVITELNESDAFDGNPIVTQVEDAREFYTAEPYHQDYVNRTGRACHPGIGAAIQEFTENLSSESPGR